MNLIPGPTGHTRTRRRARTSLAGAALLSLALVACSKDKTIDTTAAVTETTAAPADTTATGDTTVATETTVAGDTTAAPAADTTAVAAAGATAFTEADCTTNKAAGKITYLSSFDFAAAASIIDVVVAKEKGYFDKMCLDVDLKPSFSTANYPLVASNTAQFSSAGSYTEILNFSKDGAAFVALADYGHTPIEELLVKADSGITDLAGLKGKTIGVKGDIPPSIVAMLAKAGLKRGTDYKEVLLDGFDPVVQLKQVDALPVYKSNEPGQLDRAGIKFTAFNPTDSGTPGSFGLIYGSQKYAADHPTVVRDFIRASLMGMADAIADPPGAVALSVKQINAAGNSNFLTQEGETFRWTAELAEVQKGTTSGPVGVIDPAQFMAEVDAYNEAGIFKAGKPATVGTYNADLAKSLYGADGKVIWPS